MNILEPDILVAVLSLLILAVAVWLAVNLSAKRSTQLDRSKLRSQWQEVRKLLAGGETKRYAVIEADKLLDTALKGLNFKGENMGERLKSANASLGNQNAVWSAHKLRNKLVHESDYHPNQSEINTAVVAFEKAMKKLGAL